MKIRVIISIALIILLISILSMVYYKTNYMTLEEAVHESKVPIDEIFHITENKGHTVIFYGKDDMLSVGLIEKNLLGYHWVIGHGSKSFNIENQILTRSFSNLHPNEMKSEQDLVSLTFGAIIDDSIEKIMIKYKDQVIAEATIIETSKGRIWYCFSKTPFNYDPEVTRLYKDGTVKSGWY